MNTKHIESDAMLLGFRLESGAVTPGLAVKRGTAEDQCKPCVANDTILGITALDQNTGTANDPVSIRFAQPGAICYAQIGAVVAVDSFGTPDANGRFINTVSGNKRQVRFLSAGAAAQDLVPVLILDGDKLEP